MAVLQHIAFQPFDSVPTEIKEDTLNSFQNPLDENLVLALNFTKLASVYPIENVNVN